MSITDAEIIMLDRAIRRDSVDWKHVACEFARAYAPADRDYHRLTRHERDALEQAIEDVEEIAADARFERRQDATDRGELR